MKIIRHIAAPDANNIQQCSRCGYTIERDLMDGAIRPWTECELVIVINDNVRSPDNGNWPEAIDCNSAQLAAN